jgi:hypothetical protein
LVLKLRVAISNRNNRAMSRNTVTLDIQQICTWLGLPPGTWPPDHYTLLGLPPGEPDIERIEHQVHERLTRLRCYQLSHAALATEAMTHLAKVFDCLTTPERKKAYDDAHFPHLPTPSPKLPSSRITTTLASDTAETASLASPSATSTATPPTGSRPQVPMAWKPAAAPPPVRLPATDQKTPRPTPYICEDAAEPPPVRVPPTDTANHERGPEIFPQPETACSNPPSSVHLVNDSVKLPPTYLTPAALQLLGTRRDLFERVLWTRRLCRTWNRAAKYLANPKRRLVKSAEAAELTRLLRAIDEILQESPGLLGRPGQPGYRVRALAKQEPVAEHFKTLEDDQREALAADHAAGSRLLDEYREHLMDQVKGQRRLSSWQRGCREGYCLLGAYFLWILFGSLGLVAALVLLAAWLW